ncbi:4a-hydroxytetrahydrobiopterin dehydratase [Virgibacillus halotolerans]|uniref:4a-hydroxytetrahydrobiopterin dehydratase n=1 Tax=Virgibacillus halotolerans TaxID=1071053 RepID=UPI00195F7FA2|nr:4a-hydroxytetrahydrobiopterin dehydratase [Virgibacillus halotolerans]MBM7601394.1 4a-hydroxytetrahydrobiopterin dehydratase [Virgibacillus halotolerans]
MVRLSEEKIEEELQALPDWERLDEKWMARKYRFKNFLAGINFVNQVAVYAEKDKHHHPFISIDYKVVTLKISSWQEKGITALDFEMANHFDELYELAEK